MKLKTLAIAIASSALLAAPVLLNAANGGKTVTVTTENIDEILESGQPVLIDFWASWCGPCRKLAPSVEALAEEYDGKIIIGKLNIDEQPALRKKYRIRAIPTLKIFKNGKMVDEIVGAASKDRIAQRIDAQL